MTRETNRGENSSQAKLTAEQVLELRRRHDGTPWYRRPQDQRLPGSTLKALAKEFGVQMTTISRVVTRKTWRHL